MQPQYMLELIGEQFEKQFRRMYLNHLESYEPYSLSFVEDRGIYVACFDAWWWDDEDLVDGSYVVYCTLNTTTGWTDILDTDSVERRLCEEEGSVLDRIPKSFEASTTVLWQSPAPAPPTPVLG